MFSNQEQQIITWSKQNGKSVFEMKEAIQRYRRTGSPKDTRTQSVQLASGSRFSDIRQDLEETATGVFDTIEKARGRFKRADEDTSLGGLSGLFQKVGAVGSAGFELVGTGAIGAAKTLMSPAQEQITKEAFRPAAESETLQDFNNFMIEFEEKHPNWRAALGFAEIATAPFGVGAAKGAVTATGVGLRAGRELIGEGVDTAVGAVKGLKGAKVSSVASKQTTQALEREATKAAAELLQSGSKKAARGRQAEFNNADIQAMRALRDSTVPVQSQQGLADFFDSEVSRISKARDKELQPHLTKAVDNTYQLALKDEVRALMRAGDTKTARGYFNILKREQNIFDVAGKSAKGGKNTVEHLSNRIKAINQEVTKLFNEVGGKDKLLPDQKIEVQAYELLRRGLKDELDGIAGTRYAELGSTSSGLQDARQFARIQRDRAKNALSDTPWADMTLKERTLFIKDHFPTLKDFGVKALVKLDTKADVLDGLVEAKVRQIRRAGQEAIQGSPKSSSPSTQGKSTPTGKTPPSASQKLESIKGLLKSSESSSKPTSILARIKAALNDQRGFVKNPLAKEAPLPTVKRQDVSLDNLTTEAKKFKTADEFVKAGIFSEARDSSTRGIIRKQLSEITEAEPPQILKPNKNNPKLDKDTVSIKEEIIEDGGRPYVLIDGVNVIDGHHTLQAYLNLGFDEIPTIQKSQLTDIWNKANKK